MGSFLLAVSVILIALLLIKPIIYVVATVIFIFKTFGKALLFYALCIGCFFFTKWIGLDAKFPPITGFQTFCCVICVLLAPLFLNFNKIKK